MATVGTDVTNAVLVDRDTAHTVRDLIDHQAAVRGDAPFLIAPGTNRTVSFARLRDSARSLCEWLNARGVAPGERVALLLDSGLFTIEALVGTLYAGRVVVPLNPDAAPSEAARSVRHSDARTVLIAPRCVALLAGETSPSWSVAVTSTDPDERPGWVVPVAPTIDLPPITSGDDGLQVYTSGTTGRPKAVVHSQGGFVMAGLNVAAAHRLGAEDRALCAVPLYHTNALTFILTAVLASGGSLVIPRRFDVTTFWDVVVRHRCTWIPLVPSLIAQLLSRTERPAGTLGHVRFVRSSSAPLAPARHREFEARFGLALIEGMGSSEGGAGYFANPPPPGLRKIGSPGLPIGIEVRIVDGAGEEVPAGQSGEIVVRGPSVMKGYYKDPAATAAVLSGDGWLRTGDLGFLDEEGYVFVVGRAKDIIIKAGEKIVPREVDELLAAHPAVLESATVGVPHPDLGEDVVTYVALRPGTTASEDELSALCDRELGYFKAPTRIHVIDQLPRGPSRKVDRLWLIEDASRRSEAAATERQSQPRPSAGYVAPRTLVERIIAESWSAVLGLERIGVHDDFLDLGGSSLMAVRILARLDRVLPAGLSLGRFLDRPTIAEQAAFVDQALLDTPEAARLLAEIEALPDEEVARRLVEGSDDSGDTRAE